MACGEMTFIEKISNFRTFFFFYYIFFVNDIYVITAPSTLKDSRNIRGFALIRAVLLFFDFSCFNYSVFVKVDRALLIRYDIHV